MRSKRREVTFELLHALSRESSGEQRTKFAHFTCITFAQYCSIRDVASEGVYAIAGWIPIVGSDLQS